MQDWLVADNLITLAAVITAMTIVVVALTKTSKFIKRIVHFFDDYFGEEERPGVEARPGFSQRLDKIEKCMEKVDSRLNTIEFKLDKVEKELYPNSGTSLRDAVNRIEKRIETTKSKAE